ncbi:MAG: hypothetical protein R3C15_12345 [Thermoleophilia bacterium]
MDDRPWLLRHAPLFVTATAGPILLLALAAAGPCDDGSCPRTAYLAGTVIAWLAALPLAWRLPRRGAWIVALAWLPVAFGVAAALHGAGLGD